MQKRERSAEILLIGLAGKKKMDSLVANQSVSFARIPDHEKIKYCCAFPAPGLLFLGYKSLLDCLFSSPRNMQTSYNLGHDITWAIFEVHAFSMLILVHVFVTFILPAFIVNHSSPEASTKIEEGKNNQFVTAILH